ncbi:ATP-binding cassette domain-containing protein [Brachybacterium sp. AOP43-C2-M15]|uniref:ATP-binding cassette domain-containing protein n=1 Tax=Brachybacterium sp. AOP43-C2-M15 TaxID=3457661 RepID=UPI004034B617
MARTGRDAGHAPARDAEAPRPGADPPAIRAVGLHKHYGEVAALDGFDLEVAPGTIHGLLGPNGAGKSTAVGALTTLLDIDSGSARVAGIDVRSRGAEVRRRVGLIGQQPAVDEILGGRENLVMFGMLHGAARRAAQHRADELLEQFGLAGAAQREVSTYSGGMRRRLDIAAGMIADPAVLFLDEPTTGLDPRGRIDVWDAVGEIAARGTTVLLTTQYLEEADQLAGSVSIMRAGRVIAEGSPRELKARRGGDRVEVTVPAGESVAHVAAALTAAGSTVADRTLRDRSAPSADEEAGVVTVPAPHGAIDLLEVVRRLDAAGIAPDDIALRRPTLDEVFLALTEEENR